MRNLLLTVIFLSLCLPAGASAQTRPAPEIGMRAVWSHVRGEFSDGSQLNFPGEPLSPPSLYATLFVSDKDAAEPHLGLIWSGGNWIAAVGGQVTHFFSGGDRASPLAFVHGNVITGGGGGTATALGAGVGHRWIVSKGLGVRLDARYRRWVDRDRNEFSLVLGLGARLLP